MDLPEGSSDLLVGPARDAFKLIRSGRGKGPIAEEFQRIQKEEGDEAAIVFLAAEADGMQITPYGLCMNSFVIEPCPMHLECRSEEHTSELQSLMRISSAVFCLIKQQTI